MIILFLYMMFSGLFAIGFVKKEKANKNTVKSIVILVILFIVVFIIWPILLGEILSKHDK